MCADASRVVHEPQPPTAFRDQNVAVRQETQRPRLDEPSVSVTRGCAPVR